VKEPIDKTVVKLLENLKKKKEYMKMLKDLALKQKLILSDFESGGSESLLDILEERRNIIREVDRLNSEVYGEKRERELGNADLAERKGFPVEALELEREAAELAKEIYDIDRESMKIAQETVEEIKEKIKEVNLHRKSKDFYKGKGKGFSGVFLNEKR